MSSLRNPVGRQPSSVYWRRRLVVLLGLVAIITVIVLIVNRPAGGNPAAQPDPAATDAAAGDEVPECDPASVAIEAIVDSSSYGADQLPQLSLAITNTGTTPCNFSAGSDVQEYRITSGADLIWSSRDCQTAPQAAVVTLEPGKPISTVPISWDRTRSDPTTCDQQERDPVPAGGASYHLEVSVNGIEAPETRQFMLL